MIYNYKNWFDFIAEDVATEFGFLIREDTRRTLVCPEGTHNMGSYLGTMLGTILNLPYGLYWYYTAPEAETWNWNWITFPIPVPVPGGRPGRVTLAYDKTFEISCCQPPVQRGIG